MGFIGTAVVYVILGGVVAVALLLHDPRGGPWKRAGQVILAIFFWPLLAPTLLGAAPRPSGGALPLPARVGAIQAQLLTGLGGLRGVAEEILAPELARVRGLDGALAQMEQRLTEMDALLATPEFDPAAAQAALAALEARGVAEDDPRRQSLRARLRNIERLRGMRTRTSEDLERVVLKLEEMGSQLQLLRFAGGSDADAVRLLKDIAASVEEVTEGLLAAPPEAQAARRG